MPECPLVKKQTQIALNIPQDETYVCPRRWEFMYVCGDDTISQ